MDFLLSHWHCILPAIAIVIGLLFMREKRPAEKKKDDNHSPKKFDMQGEE